MSSQSRKIDRIGKRFDISITLPGSKSLALRHLLIAALSEGQIHLVGIPPCDDIESMVGALHGLGVRTTSTPEGLFVDPTDLNFTSNIELDLGMSGVSLRLLCALAGLRSGTTSITGHPSLAARPNHDLLNALQLLGCEVESNQGKLPIEIKGPIRTHKVEINVERSSQFLSALLLIAPTLPDGLEISLVGNLASKSYVDLTIATMSEHGVEVTREDQSIRVEQQDYSFGTYQVEGDASAMTYHAALATVHGARTTITNLGSSSIQGDMKFLKICEELGSHVQIEPRSISLEGPTELKAVSEVDMFELPDAATTLMAVAPYLPEPIHISGLDTLPHKECDRIACPAQELAKAGINVETGSNFIDIEPAIPRPVTFATYHDHRMAMSFAVLASKIGGCWIKDPSCVNKTYPEFWNDFARYSA